MGLFDTNEKQQTNTADDMKVAAKEMTFGLLNAPYMVGEGLVSLFDPRKEKWRDLQPSGDYIGDLGPLFYQRMNELGEDIERSKIISVLKTLTTNNVQLGFDLLDTAKENWNDIFNKYLSTENGMVPPSP